MRVIVRLLSWLAIVPLVLVLAYFGLIGLMGAAEIMVISWGLAMSVCVSAFFFRPNDYGSLLGSGQAIHLLIVGLAVGFVVTMIESPNTDSGYYRPIYFWFSGLLILMIAPFLHRHIGRKEAEKARSSS